MFFRLKNLVVAVALLIALWIGWHVYGYFFDGSMPTIELHGIKCDDYYCDDMQCVARVKHRYNVADIAVWLDDKMMGSPLRVNRRSFEGPVPIYTKKLADGKHRIKVEVTDGTRHHHKVAQEIDFNIDNMPLHAAFVRPDSLYKVSQGKTLHLQFQVNKAIKGATAKMLAKEFTCFPEADHSHIYECFIPVACEESPNEYPFIIEIEDHVGNRMNLEGKMQVIPYPFKRRILNVSKDKIAAEKEAGESQELLEARIAELVAQSPTKKMWKGMFIVPVTQTGFSCSFGEIRTTQEKGRYTHNGLDVLAFPRSVVWASQDGKVVLKDRFAYSGNTIVLDHGMQVFSFFFHLEDFADINEGDMVKKGNPIGFVGKTGYATGYHLHWEMRIGNVPVDPMQWISHDF